MVLLPPLSQEMKDIEAILRCNICYDFMTTSMMTKCSHNYCSICIRKYLTFKSQCPTCFKETGDADLRNNRVLDDIITLFIKFKDSVQEVQQEGLRTPNKKRQEGYHRITRVTEDSSKNPSAENITRINALKTPEKFNFKEYFSPRKVTPVTKGSFSGGCSSTAADVGRIETSASPGPSRPTSSATPGGSRATATAADNVGEIISCNLARNNQVNSKKVACPVCSVDVSEMYINTHLDACLKRQHEGVPAPPVRRERARIPKYVYHLMADKDIRKKIREFKLNSFGDRKTLISRLQRYTVLYNAECDSSTPMEPHLIVQQVERDEAEEKRAATRSKRAVPIHKKSDEDEIEKYRSDYLKSNDSHYSKLISEVRNRQQDAGQKSTDASFSKNESRFKRINRLDSDDEDEDDLPNSSPETAKEDDVTINQSQSAGKEDSSQDSDVELVEWEKPPIECIAISEGPDCKDRKSDDSDSSSGRSSPLIRSNYIETYDEEQHSSESSSCSSPIIVSRKSMEKIAESPMKHNVEAQMNDGEQLSESSARSSSLIVSRKSIKKIVQSPMKRTKEWVEEAANFQGVQRRSTRIAKNASKQYVEETASDDVLHQKISEQSTVIGQDEEYLPESGDILSSEDSSTADEPVTSQEVAVSESGTTTQSTSHTGTVPSSSGACTQPASNTGTVTLSSAGTQSTNNTGTLPLSGARTASQDGELHCLSDSENTQPVTYDAGDTQSLEDTQLTETGVGSVLSSSRNVSQEEGSSKEEHASPKISPPSTPLKNLQLFAIRSPILTRRRKRNRAEAESTPELKRTRRLLNKK